MFWVADSAPEPHHHTSWSHHSAGQWCICGIQARSNKRQAHLVCAVENTIADYIAKPRWSSAPMQPQPLLAGITGLGNEDSVSPQTFCLIGTDHRGKGSWTGGLCTVKVDVTCPIETKANAAPADTGLPFPCAPLLLFHLDVDEGRMWVSACLPGRESTCNVEVPAFEGASLSCMCPAVQPVFHAKLHVMLLD